MKGSILCAVMTTLMLFTGNIPVQAVTVYPDAYALYQSWEGDYPDGVSGVWSETGDTDHLVFGIAAGADAEQVKAMILEQIENQESVSFVDQNYSNDMLYGIMDSIAESPKVEGMYAWGLDQEQNCVSIGVDLENPSPELQAFMDEYTEKYGDAVQFYECDGIHLTASEQPDEADTPPEPDSEWSEFRGDGDAAEDSGADSEAEQSDPDAEYAVAEEDTLDFGGVQDDYTIGAVGAAGLESTSQKQHTFRLVYLVAGLLLLGGIGGILLRRRAQRLVQGNTGKVQSVSAVHPDIPAMMRQTAAAPPAELRQKILDDIAKK